MSLTSDELNYLIWRYLQEAGHEISAFALQDETCADQLESKFGSRIKIGCLVDLVQKGILYTEDADLVDDKGQLRLAKDVNRVSLFGAVKDSDIEGVLASVSAANGSSGNVTSEKAGQDKQQSGELKHSSSHEAKDATTAKKDSLNGVSGGDNAAQSGGLVTKQEPLKDSEPAGNQSQNETFTKVLSAVRTVNSCISVEWNPRDANLLVLAHHEAQAEIFNISTGFAVQLAHSKSFLAGDVDSDVTSVAWSPSGSLLASASASGEIRLWTIQGKLRSVLSLHHEPVMALAWQSDGSRLLSHDSAGNVIVWDASSGSAIQHVTSVPQASAAASWLGNARFAVPGAVGAIVLYQAGDTTSVGTLTGHSLAVSCLEFDEELRLLASGSDDGTVRIWRGNSALSVQVLYSHDQPVVSVHWLSGGLLLSGSLDGSLKLWNVYSGELIAANYFNGVPVYESKVSPSKERVCVALEDGSVSILAIGKDDLAGLSKQKEESKAVGRIAVSASFQPEFGNVDDTNYVSGLSWKDDSNEVCVGYSKAKSVILGVD